jgi:hypothetical protein
LFLTNFKSKPFQYWTVGLACLRLERMVNHKVIVLTVTVLFVLSACTYAACASVECPRCHGTGQITNPYCPYCGGSGYIQPNITESTLGLESNKTQTALFKIIHNNEDVDVYGIATAEINTQKTILTETSNRTLLKANSDTRITLIFEGLEDQASFVHSFDFVAESIPCPECNGTGVGTVTVCPECGGTGYISEDALGGFDFANLVLPVIGVGVVAAVSAAGFLVVKKRRWTEEKVRSFTSSEFQRWVLGRFRGTEASISDVRKGIDGFTGDGVAVVAKQADNISKSQVDSFLNSLMQVRARQGVFVAFSFTSEASAAIVKGRINYRIDVKLVTVKELLARKDAGLI